MASSLLLNLKFVDTGLLRLLSTDVPVVSLQGIGNNQFDPNANAGNNSVYNRIIGLASTYGKDSPNKLFQLIGQNVNIYPPGCTNCVGTVTPSFARYIYTFSADTNKLVNNKKLDEMLNAPWTFVNNQISIPSLYVANISDNNNFFGADAFDLSLVQSFTADDFTSNGTLYITVSYQNPEINGSTYQVYMQLYLVYTSTDNFGIKCCGSVNISPTVRTLLCPPNYSQGRNNACNDLVNKYCIDPKNNTNSLCGCYKPYVDNIVKNNQSLATYLKKQNISFPPGCSASCTTGIAWIPDPPPECKLTICTADINAIGGSTFNSKVTISQKCGDNTGGDNTLLYIIIGIIAVGGIFLLVMFVMLIRFFKKSNRQALTFQ